MAIDSDGDYIQDGSDNDIGKNNNSSDYNSSDSDGADSDDPDLNISGVRKVTGSGGTGTGSRKVNRRKQRERWEGSVGLGPGKGNGLQQGGGGSRAGKNGKDSGDMDLDVLREAAAGGEGIANSVEGILEARKRKRVEQRDTTPLQRGIIRHVLLVLDLSEAMLDKDMRPNRYLVAIRYAQEYVREFFEQNPISQLGVLAMHDGVCIRVSDLGGNPGEHMAALASLRDDPRTSRQPKGSPSLQNALEMARASLFHTPSHGTREVVIVLGALVSLDPDDIHRTIDACVRDRLRVAIIGMSARLKICQEICERTNAGSSVDDSYTVALDQQHFRELLMATTTPPVIRSDASAAGKESRNGAPTGRTQDQAQPSSSSASLLMMGFPSRTVETAPSICACHGNIQRGGYPCSRCGAKVCSLPTTCPACGLTLILSTHLARSYHHLFPLRGWVEVSWERAVQVGSTQCKGCLSPLPDVPKAALVMLARKRKRRLKRMREKMRLNANGAGGNAGANDVGNDNDDDDEDDTDVAPLPVKVEGASESSRYECESCGSHFCVDCDVFCHEVVHNCPGCLSGTVGNGGAHGKTRGVEGVEALSPEKGFSGKGANGLKQHKGGGIAADPMEIG